MNRRSLPIRRPLVLSPPGPHPPATRSASIRAPQPGSHREGGAQTECFAFVPSISPFHTLSSRNVGTRNHEPRVHSRTASLFFPLNFQRPKTLEVMSGFDPSSIDWSDPIEANRQLKLQLAKLEVQGGNLNLRPTRATTATVAMSTVDMPRDWTTTRAILTRGTNAR